MPRGKHGNHARGSKHPRWNDARQVSEHGYVKVRVGLGHPLADPNGYAYEHLVVWAAAGRALPREGEVLHHKNGDKQDNRIDNLELLTKAEHNRHHVEERGRDEGGRFLPAAGSLLDGVEHKAFPEVIS